MAEETKSGICGPAGYNGADPASLAAPVKVYPGSGDIGKGKGGKNTIEGPCSGDYGKRKK